MKKYHRFMMKIMLKQMLWILDKIYCKKSNLTKIKFNLNKKLPKEKTKTQAKNS